jgi:hypothetical protein
MSAWEVDERMENRERHEGRRRSGEGLGGEERDVTILTSAIGEFAWLEFTAR